MTRHAWIVTLTMITALSVAGFGLLTADEPAIPRQQRVSPKVLKDAINSRPVMTATATHSLGRSLHDLKTLAADLESSGSKAEAERLQAIIKEFVRHIELHLSEKKAQVTQLNAEIEELRTAAGL